MSAGYSFHSCPVFRLSIRRQHSRHWPESSIKSSQANVGGEMLFLVRNARGDFAAEAQKMQRREELCIFRPARLRRLPA